VKGGYLWTTLRSAEQPSPPVPSREMLLASL